MSAPARGLSLLACTLVACASVPANRYGVKALEIEGMRTLDEDSLKACLATGERPRAGFTLGTRAAGECGEPPFDARHLHVRLWSWPITDWPLYDRIAFARDQERILRWYEARGFHGARVLESSVQPAQAAQRDTIDAAAPGCQRVSAGAGCSVRLRVLVDEGAPTLITTFAIRGLAQVPASLRARIWRAAELRRGARLDEARYDADKRRILTELHEDGYALARVSGQARVDRAAHRASVELVVKSGPVCRFGDVLVVGAPSFLTETVRAMTLIDRGDRFSLETLQSAQRAVFSSGGFSSVSVEPVLPRAGNVVDVRVSVTPARKHRFGLGLGVQSGIVTRGDTWDPISIPQWDVHLVIKYTQQRFLSGPRTLVLENRPALIVQEPFPGFTTPRFGNELRAQLRQAGVFEPRTALQVAGAYIWGPDPFDTFFRHRVDSGVGLERRFLREERMFLSMGIRNSVYRVPSGEVTMDGSEPSASSILTYMFLRTRFDYRDNDARPHKGFMLQTELQGAGFGPASSWRYVRSTPDVRIYVPLPFEITFAVRFALGLYFIFKADAELDELSRALGPRDYRLRGGGATSNRGFLPGQLGDGSDGGTRRWEGSAELRLPFTAKLGLVGFFDVGDVSKKPEFRWRYPQASSGFGLRYHTLVGALRLDFAWRIKGLQVFGPDERLSEGTDTTVDFGFTEMHGAVHLTIGESF